MLDEICTIHCYGESKVELFFQHDMKIMLKRGKRGGEYIFFKLNVCFKRWVVNKTLVYHDNESK